MKYSIIICPNSENSIAIRHAYLFIESLLLDSRSNQANKIDVFFYGLAVKAAFIRQLDWQNIYQQGVQLSACSTIAESFKSRQVMPYFSIVGLAQWMESSIDADKNIEFI